MPVLQWRGWRNTCHVTRAQCPRVPAVMTHNDAPGDSWTCRQGRRPQCSWTRPCRQCSPETENIDNIDILTLYECNVNMLTMLSPCIRRTATGLGCRGCSRSGTVRCGTGGNLGREIAIISSSSASFDPACVGFLWPRVVRTRQYSPQHGANIQFGLCGTCININGVEMKWNIFVPRPDVSIQYLIDK